jgi:hypothetical protein
MIIGLTGFAGSGKDTVAEILVQEHGFKRYAFADKLREMAYAINPLVMSSDHGGDTFLQELVDDDGWDVVKRELPQVRELLQRLGVWHRENVSEDFWVDFVHRQWVADGYPNAVITDVRFPNEAFWVRAHATPFDDAGDLGELWRVTRPGVGPVNDHISEKLDLAADQTVLNNGTLLDLRETVWALMKGEQAA